MKVLSGIGFIKSLSGDVAAPVGGQVTVDDKTVSTDVESQQTRIPLYENAAAGVSGIVKNVTSKVTMSEYSNDGHFSTLFNDFGFEAIPCYNFYVTDEETNETEELGLRKLSDVPRYITLRWRRAPSIRSNIPPGNKRVRSHGFKMDLRSHPLMVDGLEFKKKRIDEFSIAKRMVANGYISPGAISTIIELPLAKTSISDDREKIDELRFLSSNVSDISIHDLQKTLNTKSGFASSADMTNASTRDDLFDDKEKFFDGNFSIDPSNGSIDIDGVTADTPAISMKISTVTDGNGSNKSDYADKIVQQFSNVSSKEDKSAFTEVNFFDTAIHGLVDEQKVGLMTRPEHVENMVALGQYLPNLTMMSLTSRDIKRNLDIPSTPSADINSGTEYIGYVIEKYRLQKNGSFSLVDEIDIPSASVTEFVDTKVAYGATYRYRIRSILKWTRSASAGDDPRDQQKVVSVKKLLSKKSSFFYGEWNRKWQYAAVIDNLPPAPPDEFTVRPESHRKRVVISWKLPHNPQRDISRFRILRKIVRDDGLELTGWTKLGVIDGGRNGLFFDNDVDYFQQKKVEYVYAAQALTVHNEQSLLSAQLAARINMKYRTDGEFDIRHVSEEGVDIRVKGALAVKPYRKSSNRFVFFDRCSLSPRLGIHDEAFSDTSYIVRIEPLDKSLHEDIKLSIHYDNVATLVREKVQNSAVAQKISKSVMENVLNTKTRSNAMSFVETATGKLVTNTATDTVGKSRRD